MDELKYLKDRVEELNQQIADEEEKTRYKEVTDRLKRLYDSMIASGFSEERAWWFVSSMVRAAFGSDF